MAITKEVKYEQAGTVAKYWAITHAQIDWNAKCCDVVLHGYASEEHRKVKDAQPFGKFEVRLADKEFPTEFKKEVLYPLIAEKEKDGFFKGAKSAA